MITAIIRRRIAGAASRNGLGATGIITILSLLYHYNIVAIL